MLVNFLEQLTPEYQKKLEFQASMALAHHQSGERELVRDLVPRRWLQLMDTTQRDRCIASFGPHGDEVTCVDVNPVDASQVVFGMYGTGSLQICKTTTGKVSRQLSTGGHEVSVLVVGYSIGMSDHTRVKWRRERPPTMCACLMVVVVLAGLGRRRAHRVGRRGWDGCGVGNAHWARGGALEGARHAFDSLGVAAVLGPHGPARDWRHNRQRVCRHQVTCWLQRTHVCDCLQGQQHEHLERVQAIQA